MSAHAELDENGIEPKHWYKFDGNLDPSGSTALSIEGENGSSYVDSGKGGQAYLFKSDGPCQPYGSGIKRGNGDFTVVTVAKTANLDHGIIWSQGTASTARGFALVTVGEDKVALRVFGSTWSSSGTDLFTATVSSAASEYHVYTLIYQNTGYKFSLYVDAATAPVGTGSVKDSATESGFPNNSFQWGSLNGGLNYSMTQGYGCCLDDFRLYQQALTTDQIKNIVASFRGDAVWGNAGSASEKGVATSINGGGYTTFNIDFGQADNISQTGIGSAGTVCIKKIRLFRRKDKSDNPPSKITISQTGVTSVNSKSVSLTTGQKIYGPNWPTTTTDFYSADAFDAVFDSTTEFDTSKPLTITFPSSQLFMIQPANSVMQVSGWSPAIEITGVYTEDTDPKTYTATLNGTKNWSELEWTPALPTSIRGIDKLVINVSGTTPTLLMDTAYSTKGSVTFSGGAVVVGAADALYEDGCWQKDILSAGSITAAGGLTFPALKEGFVGAYIKSGTAITLRAQNKEVISINFANGQSVSGTGYTGLAPVQGNTWMNMTTTWSSKEGYRTVDLGTFKATSDGSTVTTRGTIGGTCAAANTYGWNTATDVFLKGYIDDGGNHARVSVTNIPYSSYDVIVYRATDSGGYKFAAVTLNGTQYTYDSANPTTAKAGGDTWGQSQNKTAVYGTNAIRIRNVQSSTLTIDGGANANGARGCIAAIQIVCTGDVEEIHDFTATISSSTTFGDITWKEGPFKEGVLTTATITIDDKSTDEVAITFDNPAIVLKSLTIISKRAVRLVASAGLTNVASIDVSKCTGKVTYAMPVTALPSSENENVFYTGGTAEGTTVAIGLNGGVLNLAGGTYSLQESVNGTATTVNMTDSTVDYADVFGVGTATYNIGGNSVVNTPRLVLSQGAAGRTSVVVLSGDAALTVTGDKNGDNSQSSALFGHWNGSSTFTLRDNATFTAAAAQVLVGLTRNTHTINIEGGVFTALGIKASVNATGTNTLNLNGGELILGSVGISSYGATQIAVHVGGDAKITSLGETHITQPVTIDAGKTLTVDATAGDVILSGALVNNGTIKVIGGNLVIVGTEEAGTCVTEGTGRVLFGYTVTINNCGKFQIPEGKTWDEILLYDASGNKVTITGHDAKYVYFDWKITGDACWWDYEFEGNVNNAGTDGVALSWDGDRPYKNNEYVTNEETGEMSLRIPSRPWRNVGSWPEVATFVMYGTMVSSNKTYQIGFGSTYTGSKYTIFLATDDVASGTVDLCLSYEKNAPTVLCTMKVPNAQSSKHLYAFVLKTEGGKTVVNTYLDGELLQPYTHEAGVVTLGGGFQIGSGFGGVAAGYDNAKEGDPALMDWLRVYNLELNHEAMAEYAKKYPYVPANGSYQRDVTGTAAWDKDKAWTKEGTTTVTNTPASGSTVKIDADGAVGLGVNLTADATYGEIQISGDGTLTISPVPGYSGKISASRVVAKADAVFSYEAFDMAGAPLVVEDGRTVTFDMTSVDLDVWSPVSYDLTGLVTTGENAKVVCTYGTVPTGRSVSYGIDPADQHFKFIVGVNGTLTADLSGDSTFDNLAWKVGEESVTPVWDNKKVYGTINVLSEGATLTFDSSMTSADSILSFAGDKAVTLATRNEAEVKGLTYDFTGLDAKATFAFDPDPSMVRAGYVRYDLDMGTYAYGKVLMSAGGRYEFKRIRIDGNGYDYHDRLVIVQPEDYLNLHDGSTLGCGVSLDVRGGEVHLGTLDGSAAVAYGQNGTRFNQSGGTVTVHATGTAQTGVANGFVLSHSATGGGCHEFNITGGLFTVPESSICFNQPTNTINVSGTGVLRARGAFFAGKKSEAETAAPGVINLSDVGVLEIGSLGATADACTLNLNGGILRGYEAGAAFNSPVVQEGATTVSSTEGASLTMGGTFTGSDIVAIPEGTVKLGRDSGLGTGDLTVADGATLDVNGCKPGNAIMVSGIGADGAGALANTGGDVGFAGTLTFAGDARIGGTAKIGYYQGSTINLGGHTLTIAGRGTGATLALGGMTVQGGGAILVGEKGMLASNGATALGDECDLTIGEKGTLDLSAGNHISCRNFTNAGTITGNQAGIIVNGTLDASAATTLPKLTLHDNATLKGGADGIQLTLTTTGLTLGKTLNVTVEKVTQNIRLATVPADTPIKPEATALVVNGVSGKYTLELNGTSLLASTGGGNYADVALSSVLGWTNFESLKVDGSLENMRVITAGQTNIDVIVAYESGIATTQRFVYAGGPDGKFSYVVDGVRPGERYGVSAYVLIDSVSISVDSTTVNAMTARTLGAWIDEDYQTFGGQRIGTGSWRDDGKIASVKGETIAFAAATRDQLLSFTSTNRSQIAERGARKDILISETFTAAAYGVGEEGPALPSSAGLVAVAMTTNAQGECQFAVATNGAWQAIGREVFAPSFDKPYEIVVRIDATAETVAYGVVQGKSIVWLVTEVPYTPAAESSAVVQIVFTGSGAIAKIDGQCYDANLMQVTIDKTTREYATFEEALAAAGADNAITPLWWSNYEVSGERGAFCVVNNGYFEPLFAKWYRYEKTPGPVQDSYRYVAANNWIEYADKSGVEQTANGAYRVTSEPGLAWIAEQATNGVFEGAVTLGADLDLASRNWTPIANFTGSFDGDGHVIEGLNNTNVVIDPLLGEAGYCYGGIRNDEGYEAYGLVAFAQDAEIKNVVLSDLAISNTADSVAALVGVHVGGDLTVENVTNESGVVWGEGRATAGLVTIGGEGEPIGNVVVNGNVNRAEIVGAENAAQILAGTSADTKFNGTVEVAGNVGNGSDMPICNFAAAQNYDDGVYYWTYVEANNKGSVPIDPVNKTARMLAGYFYNGTINYMGQLTDLITASEDGAEIVVPNATTNDCWDPIVVDRNITLDLNGTCIYGVYDCDLFTVTNGAKLIIGNGELVKVEGYEYYRVATGSSVEETQPLAKGENAGTFYDRTVGVKTFGVVADRATIVIPYTSPDFTYTVQHVNTLAEAWQDVEEYTDIPGTGGEMTFELDASGGSGFYRVKMVPVFW